VLQGRDVGGVGIVRRWHAGDRSEELDSVKKRTC
jgi:hypothetical protein